MVMLLEGKHLQVFFYKKLDPSCYYYYNYYCRICGISVRFEHNAIVSDIILTEYSFIAALQIHACENIPLLRMLRGIPLCTNYLLQCQYWSLIQYITSLVLLPTLIPLCLYLYSVLCILQVITLSRGRERSTFEGPAVVPPGGDFYSHWLHLLYVNKYNMAITI